MKNISKDVMIINSSDYHLYIFEFLIMSKDKIIQSSIELKKLNQEFISICQPNDQVRFLNAAHRMLSSRISLPQMLTRQEYVAYQIASCMLAIHEEIKKEFNEPKRRQLAALSYSITKV